MKLLRIIVSLFFLIPIFCSSRQKMGTFLHLVDVFWRYKEDNCTKHLDQCIENSLSALLKNNRIAHPNFVFWSCAGGPRAINIINQFKNVFKNITVIPSLPPVRLPFSKNYHPYYQNISKHFDNWLDDKALKSFWKGGYYSMSLKKLKKLKIIVLNTAFFCHFHPLSKLDDPAGQWNWLNSELLKARNTSKKVYLLMSASPGASDKIDDRTLTSKHTARYTNMVQTFSDVIGGQFGGYEDADKFHLFTDKKGRDCGWLISTPLFYRSVRSYFFDLRTMNPSDYLQFHKVNNSWQVQFQFTRHYAVSNMSTASFTNITQAMKKDGRRWGVPSFPSLPDLPNVPGFIGDLMGKIKDGAIQGFEAVCKVLPWLPYCPGASKERIPELLDVVMKACNHTGLCVFACFCKLLSLSIRAYVECMSVNEELLLWNITKLTTKKY